MPLPFRRDGIALCVAFARCRSGSRDLPSAKSFQRHDHVSMAHTHVCNLMSLVFRGASQVSPLL